MQLVEYIGRKPKQTDTVAGTSTVWLGAGDVQEVSDEAWAAMAKHPFVWRLAEKKAEPATSTAPTGGLSDAPNPDAVTTTTTAPVELDTMDTAALRAYAKAKGYAVDLSQKAKDLRPAIRAIEAGA